MKYEWENCKLYEVADIVDSLHKTPQYTECGLPMLRVTDIKEGYLSLRSPAKVSPETYDEFTKKHKPKQGDIVVSRVGTYGVFAYVATKDKFCLGQNTAIIIPHINKKFLYYSLISEETKEYLNGIVTGSTQKTISLKNIKTIPLSLPNDTIQERIADILSALDDKIELNKKINENLERQAMTIFKSWFVDYMPYGGTVPKEWRHVILDNITSLVTRGIAPKYSNDSDQTVINQKCIRNHMIDLSLARTHTPKGINEKWLQYGDLLINSTGIGTLGRSAQVWFKPKNLTVDSHVTIVRPAKENLIFYIGLWGISHEKEIESLHTGSTGQTELPRDRVKAMELLLPDDVALNRFHSIIAPLAASIVSNQEENLKLAELRDILLPKLMSGEINIGDVNI